MSEEPEAVEQPLEVSHAPINTDDFNNWTVSEVVAWCISSLGIAENDLLVEQIRGNEITGELLPELALEDCKELCGGDLNKSIRLKVLLNKLQDDVNQRSQMQEQQEHMVVALKNLYSTTSQKMQDYQTQYGKLRLDILEIVKASNAGTRTPAQHQTPYATQAPQAPHDYFDGPHHQQQQDYGHTHLGAPTPMPSVSRKNSTLSAKPTVSRSTSSNLNDVQTNAIGSEPLKQLRASKEDSCERILKNAMKRHNLADHDWRQYVLVICYGDQERILDLEEKPVLIFKNLKQQGLHPAIMLRRRGDFEELNMGGDDVTPGGRL